MCSHKSIYKSKKKNKKIKIKKSKGAPTWTGLFIAFALFEMGISSHSAFPLIHTQLKNPEKWKVVCITALG